MENRGTLKTTDRTGAAGFTLIEILLVISLLSLTSLAVMSTFLQGIKIFGRMSGMNDEFAQAFFMEQLEHDLKNSANYSLIPWTVSENALSFGSLPVLAGSDDPMAAGIPVRIDYRYDQQGKRVIRSKTSFPYNPGSEDSAVVAENAQSLRFDVLRDSEESPPSRVTISIGIGGASHSRLLKKEITIPVSYKNSEVA